MEGCLVWMGSPSDSCSRRWFNDLVAMLRLRTRLAVGYGKRYVWPPAERVVGADSRVSKYRVKYKKLVLYICNC
jgi:hypothetical protein